MISTQRISRAQCGSREAFDELYTWLFPSVYRYAWAQVGDRGAAEEVTSEAFMVFITQFNELPTNDSAVLAWMRVVVRNKAVDWVRRSQTQRRAMTAMTESGARSSSDVTPMHQLESKEERHLVHVVLDRLQDDYRQVLELRYLDDLSTGEIAEVLELSLSAANSLLFRARKSFRSEHRRLVGVSEDETRSSLLRDGGTA